MRWLVQRRGVQVVIVSAALMVVVVLFRFNTLSGRYGGFDNDHFAVLVRAQALADDELPLRDYEDYELRGIRPALAYLPSMWARRIVGESLLAEAVLCVAALYLAAQLTFLAALTLSGSVTIGASVALVQVFAGPKLYNWPKLLIPAAFAVLLVGRMPEPWRAAASGVVIAVAFLVRHDYAVYLAAAWLVYALASAWRGSAIDAIRSSAIAMATTAALLLPGLVWAAGRVGIVEYVTRSLAVTGQEVERSGPAFALPSLGASSFQLAEVALLWLVWAAALASLAVVAGSAWRNRPSQHWPAVAGLVVLAVLMNVAFIRRPIDQRLPDTLAPACVLGAWCVAELWRRTRTIGRLMAVAVVTLALWSGIVLNELSTQVHAAGLVERTVVRRAQRVIDELRSVPARAPVDDAEPADVVSYLRRCTNPDDRILVSGYHPEIFYLSDRRFAGGVSVLFSRFYSDAESQRRIVQRLQRQRAPVAVLPAGETYDETFASDYPIINTFIRAEFAEHRIFGSGEGALVVWVRHDRLGVSERAASPCAVRPTETILP